MGNACFSCENYLYRTELALDLPADAVLFLCPEDRQLSR